MIGETVNRIINLFVTKKWVVYTKEESNTGEEVAITGWLAVLFGSAIGYAVIFQFFSDETAGLEESVFTLVFGLGVFAIAVYLSVIGSLAIEYQTIILKGYLVRGKKAVGLGIFYCCAAVILTLATTVYLFRG